MPIDVYRFVHLFSVFLLLMSMGGMVGAALAKQPLDPAVRRLGAISHGVAMLLLLVAGFGLLAKGGYTAGVPGFAMVKLVIWLVLGAAIVVPTRFPAYARLLWLAVPLLALVAAWLGHYRPF